MLRIFSAVLTLTFAVTPVLASDQSGDCGSIAEASARLSCYDRKEGSGSESSNVGTLEGTLTWQYNDFVGTKGDTNARVVLIRLPLAENLTGIEDYHLSSIDGGFAIPLDGVIYTATADGYGHYYLPNIIAGDYLAVMVSNKTRILKADFFTADCKAKLEGQVEDLRFFNKAFCREIKIQAGDTLRLSHDFGNTGF